MNILIRIPNWLGDAVMSIPAIETIKYNFRDSDIYLVGRKPAIYIFNHYPGIKGLFGFKSKGLIFDFRTLKNIRKLDFEKGYIFPNSFISALDIYLSGVNTRVGYRTDMRSCLLSVNFEAEFSYNYHFSDYYLNLLKKEGLKVNKQKIIRLYISDFEKKEAEEILEAKKGKINIGAAPGASFGDAKKWFHNRFNNVFEYFEKKYDARIFLFGNKNDLVDCNKASTEKSVNLCGKTTIRQAMALIKNMDIFISNDSGLMHIASALEVPVLGIFGSTSPDSTYPYNKNHKIVFHKVYCSPCKKRKCPYDVKLCMNVVDEKEVIKKSEELFG